MLEQLLCNFILIICAFVGVVIYINISTQLLEFANYSVAVLLFGSFFHLQHCSNVTRLIPIQ
jgi:hypothetical protein